MSHSHSTRCRIMTRLNQVQENDYLMVISHELRLARSDAGQGLFSPRENQSLLSTTRNQAVDAASQLQLEEVQVVFFFFPAKRVMITLGANSEESPVLERARQNLRNRRSALRKDCRIKGGGGLTTLLVVILDAMLDNVFPILDLYGNALEGLQLLNSKHPARSHVVLAQKLKTKVTQIRRYAWDFKGLLQELHQDMSAPLSTPSSKRYLIRRFPTHALRIPWDVICVLPFPTWHFLFFLSFVTL